MRLIQKRALADWAADDDAVRAVTRFFAGLRVLAPLDQPDFRPTLSDDFPAGESLEFDPAFGELERLAQGKPEQQFGSTIIPAEEPDWKAVIDAATALGERTLDLRVMAHLAVARLHREGLRGYAAEMVTISHVVRTRWADVHPRLDPEDDNDPLPRANALLSLAQPGQVLRVLRAMPLARSARGGTVSWRDVGMANGTIEVAEGANKPTDAMIAGVFRDSNAEALAATRAAVAAAHASAVDIPAAFDELAGHGAGPDFTALVRLLSEIRAIIERYAPVAADPAEPETVAEPPAGDTASAAAPERIVPVMSIQTMAAPTNRADALRLLDLVVEFYNRNEPSSPLPLLIARARRLAEMDFMEILRDLAPDGVSQVERIAGTKADG